MDRSALSFSLEPERDHQTHGWGEVHHTSRISRAESVRNKHRAGARDREISVQGGCPRIARPIFFGYDCFARRAEMSLDVLPAETGEFWLFGYG